jgi:DNA helicase-2/ATP-dependent DNA helicase PcrA
MLRDLRRALRRDQHEAQAAASSWTAAGPADDGSMRAAHPPRLPPHLAGVAPPDPQRLAEACARAHAALPRFGESLARLDPWQQQAVICDDEAAVVRAHVGSGKTAVLAHRVLWWHLVHGRPLASMAIATFTTKAAAELSTRISALLDVPPPPRDFWLTGTLHGLARTLLEAGLPHDGDGPRKGFGVLDEAARQALLLQLVKDHGLRLQYRNQLATRVRDFLRDGQVRRGAMRSDDDLAILAALYRQAKQSRNVLDFDDLIGHATQLVRQGPVVPLRALIIDELQDCAPDEVALLHALVQPPAGPGDRPDVAFFAVGDPNQSIYTWRGTDPQVFGTLSASLSATIYDLPRNYRSTPEILAAASGVLGQQASGTALQATRDGGARVHIRRHHDPHMEGLYLSGRLQQLHHQGSPWHELAVLTRTKRQLEQLRQVLDQQGVPCSEVAAPAWSDWPMAHWWLQVLVAAGEDDAVAVHAALTLQDPGILGARWLRRTTLARHLDQPTAPPLTAATARGATDTAPTRLQRLGGLLRQRALEPRHSAGRCELEAAAAVVADLTGIEAIDSGDGREDALWQHLRLDQRLRPAHRDHHRDVAHLEATVRELTAIRGQRQGTWAAAAAELLRAGPASCNRAGVGDAAGTATDGVRLLTLHASKGLEFRHVFVSGCNHGVIPLASAWGDPAAIAEERRLLFVGLTRARDSLEVSWHTRPVLPQALPMPSDWLLAIPSTACAWDDGAYGGATPAALQQTMPACAAAAGRDDSTPHAAAAGRTPTASGQAAAAADVAGAASSGAAGAWRVGQPVQHPKYGVGTVLGCDASEVRVDFGKLGERSFSLLLCPLREL